MSFPVIEVVTLHISEKLKADHSLLKPTIDTLLEQPGCKKVSWGTVIEEPNTALVFIGVVQPSHSKFISDYSI